MNFSQYLIIAELTEKAGALLVPESWVDDIAKMLPQMDLGLPKITKSGSIAMVLQKQNPIFVQLDDDSKIFFTPHQFKRICGEKPEKGKKMTVTFQRLGNDSSKEPSQIVHAIVA